ncbi:MAG TPA: hypothetical protein PKX92_03485 [Edaphocola sp.]|nr:hypothetical protein [Edaphocola sp.]
MAFKYKVLYILIYSFLNIIGIYIALNFWWTDSLTFSYFGKEIAGLLISIALSWLGTLHLSILLSRIIFLKNDNYYFIGIWQIIESKHYITDKIDENTKKLLFNSIFYIGFPIFIITILLFIFSVNEIENYQIDNYGIKEKIKTEKIAYDIKENKFFVINYNNMKNQTYLPLENYNVGDTIEIIFSAKNPKIIKYLKDYQ